MNSRLTVAAAIFLILVSTTQSWAILLVPPSPTLTSVTCKLTTGSKAGDSLDSNSTLIFVLHPTHDGKRYAEFQFEGRDATGGSTNNGDVKRFPLTLHTTSLTKSQVDHQFSIDMIINAVGRDHYAGHLEALLNFSDGSICSLDDDFAIGTFHESNQTGKVVTCL